MIPAAISPCDVRTASERLALMPGKGDSSCHFNIQTFAWQVVQVGEQNGLRFPREFALLVKQLLYFDR